MKQIKVFIALSALVFAFNSCKNGDSELGKSPQGIKIKSNSFLKEVKIAESSMPISIFPHRITLSAEAMIAGQVFEGLTKIDPSSMKVKPGLAERWEISEDGKSITFYLRKGVNFHPSSAFNGKSVELTADDVKFTFELLSTEGNNNLHFGTVCKDRIVGANDHYERSKIGEKIDLTGVQVIDKYTVKIDLLNSPSIFLEILGNPVSGIISRACYESQKDNCRTGAGPFMLDADASTPNTYVLIKNPDYYGKDKNGTSLPYLDRVVVDIVSGPEIAWTGFRDGTYDYVGTLPVNQLKEIVEENIASFKGEKAPFLLERGVEMTTQYYLFNLKKPPFNNQKVRQAFNYAIDRDKIIEKVLFGQAYGPATSGMVPPTFDFYDTKEIKGYTYDADKARKLLAEAGYANGKNFPEVQLLVNSGNSRNNTIAAEIQKQLQQVLNVNVNFESLPNVDKFLLQTAGKGDMFRDGWVADYPSPESFLSVFYGAPVDKDTSKISYPNTIKYMNAEFDIWYEKGRDALNRDSAAVYFKKAEQILVNDAPLIPLYYESNYRLISSRLKNFYTNPLRHFDFTEVDVK
jgi:oligopeptide transport system substrate-binding protein